MEFPIRLLVVAICPSVGGGVVHIAVPFVGLVLYDIRAADFHSRDIVAEPIGTVAVYPSQSADVPLESFLEGKVVIDQFHEPLVLPRDLFRFPLIVVDVVLVEIVFCPRWDFVFVHHPRYIQSVIPICPPFEDGRKLAIFVGEQYNDGICEIAYCIEQQVKDGKDEPF